MNSKKQRLIHTSIRDFSYKDDQLYSNQDIRRGNAYEYIYIVNKLNLRKTLHEYNEQIKQRFNEQINKQHITTTRNPLIYISSRELNKQKSANDNDDTDSNKEKQQQILINTKRYNSSKNNDAVITINKQDEINLRNELIYNIAFASRDTGNGERFTEIEKDILKKYYSEYIILDNNQLIFNQNFFKANINDLIFIAQLLNLMPSYVY